MNDLFYENCVLEIVIKSGRLVKREIDAPCLEISDLVRFSGALDFAFLTSSQVKLTLLLWRCCFENYCSRKMHLEGKQGQSCR